MRIVCAWCGKELGEKEPLEDKRITHGICPECLAKYFPEKKINSTGGNPKSIYRSVAELPEFRGAAWRAESGFWHTRGTTVADIIRFEREELGNEYPNVSDELLKELDQYSASDAVWVNRRRKDCLTYLSEGESEEAVGKVPLPEGSKIIVPDYCGGYLVLRGSARTKGKMAATISEEKLKELIEDVPDIGEPEEICISYWQEINDKIVYLEGWTDACLAGTGFPPMERGETADKIAYIEDLTPDILNRKAKESGLKLLEGGFRETPDAENLYGVSYGIYKKEGGNPKRTNEGAPIPEKPVVSEARAFEKRLEYELRRSGFIAEPKAKVSVAELDKDAVDLFIKRHGIEAYESGRGGETLERISQKADGYDPAFLRKHPELKGKNIIVYHDPLRGEDLAVVNDETNEVIEVLSRELKSEITGTIGGNPNPEYDRRTEKEWEYLEFMREVSRMAKPKTETERVSFHEKIFGKGSTPPLERLGKGQAVNNMLPMPPDSGPPLPRFIGLKWPWKG